VTDPQTVQDVLDLIESGEVDVTTQEVLSKVVRQMLARLPKDAKIHGAILIVTTDESEAGINTRIGTHVSADGWSNAGFQGLQRGLKAATESIGKALALGALAGSNNNVAEG